MRSRAPFFTIQKGLVALILMLLGIWTWMGLGSCHGDRVTVNPKDPQSPQYAYRQDELALLGMMADDVQDLERKKQYATLYDDYTSQAFKDGISRRRFLMITNCVETYLGGLDAEGYDPHELGFRREHLKGGKYLDVLNRKVHRIQGLIDEQMVFVPNGLNFQLNGLYWIAKDKQFLQCVVDSSQRAQAENAAAQSVTEENTTGKSTDNATTEEKQTPSSDNAASETGPNAHGNGEPTEETSEKTGQSTEQTPSPSEKPVAKPEAPGVASPVQEMKPAEARKATTIQARPAGAGVVIDQRPAPKPKPKAPPEQDEVNDHATNEPPTPDSGKTIPSSIPPLKPAANEEPPTPGSH